jgi:hypothetical protein
VTSKKSQFTPVPHVHNPQIPGIACDDDPRTVRAHGAGMDMLDAI